MTGGCRSITQPSTTMNNLKASQMIARQRRRWHSQDSDLAIARRAERVYFGLAIMYMGIGTSLTLVQRTQFGRAAILAGFLFGALLFIWKSHRFAQIRRMLVADNTKPNAHGAA